MKASFTEVIWDFNSGGRRVRREINSGRERVEGGWRVRVEDTTEERAVRRREEREGGRGSIE